MALEMFERSEARSVRVPVLRPLKWATDRYKDAREIPGGASPRRKRSATAKFAALGFNERFELTGVIDSTHIQVRCKNCGNLFTRETSCLKEARSDKCKSANNIKCNKCGMTANGTQSYRCTENTRGMDESEVVSYYLGKHSANQTAKKFGMNLRRVRRIIDEAGVSRDRQAVIVLDAYPDVITGDPWLDEEFRCEECGRTFTRQQYMVETGRTKAVRKPPRYCSVKCSSKQSRRRGSHNRRQLELNSKGDTIPLGDLIERDNGICKICEEPVDLDDGYFDQRGNFHVGPSYPSIDHIVPLSKGGTNTWGNVQLAHLSCNSGKRDKLLQEEGSAE